MQNRKWILTSLVMTFFGIPILAQFLAVVIAMLGVGLAGIIEVCNILHANNLPSAQNFYAGAGRINAIFLGASGERA